LRASSGVPLVRETKPDPIGPVARHGRLGQAPGRGPLLPLEQPTRGPRRFVIAGVLFVASTLAALYLSLLTWWLVPAYRGPNFPKIAMTYVTAYRLWGAAAPLGVVAGRRFR